MIKILHKLNIFVLFNILQLFTLFMFIVFLNQLLWKYVNKYNTNEYHYVKSSLELSRIDPGNITNLTFYQHSHVHKHIVKFPNWVFQLYDVVMSGFNIFQGLFSLLGFHHNLCTLILFYYTIYIYFTCEIYKRW